jgi:hypothetical protein
MLSLEERMRQYEDDAEMTCKLSMELQSLASCVHDRRVKAYCETRRREALGLGFVFERER